MKTAVEKFIEQVSDGRRYQGYLKIADITFDYELMFATSISQLDKMKPAKDENEARQLFQIMVKKDGADIDLTKEEWIFFFRTLMTFAVDFYNDPQTRTSNEECLFGMTLRDEGHFSHLVKISIGMTKTSICDFSPEVCEMLNAPKFGCAL